MSAGSRTSRLDTFVSNPRRALWALAVPVMLGMALQTLYLLADMFFVGQLSASALAALSFNMPLLFLGLGIVFGLGTGVTAVVARFIGAKDKRLADSSAEHAVALGLVLSFLFTLIAWEWGRGLLATLGVPPELMPLAWNYFFVLSTGYLFVVCSVFFRSILSGEGDMKTPMMIQGAGTLLNIVLDPIFIFTLGLGVKGAALATVLSQALTTAIFVYLLFFTRHSYVTFDPRDFRLSGSIVAGIFRVGAPASFSFVIMALGAAVFNRILIEFSADTVAAYQVGARIDQIYLLPVISLAASLVTLVGMFYGARRGDLVNEIVTYAVKRSVAIALVMGTLFFVFAPQLVGLFSDTTSIQRTGAVYLRIGVFAYPFIAVIILTGRILQGMGRGLPLLLLSLLRVVLISGPLAYLFVFHFHKPVEWVWFSIVIGMAVTGTIALAWLRKGLAGIAKRRAEELTATG